MLILSNIICWNDLEENILAADIPFYRVFEASNSLVAKRWFHKEKLFEADFSDYPDSAPLVSSERAAELLAGFMLQEMIMSKGKKKD